MISKQALKSTVNFGCVLLLGMSILTSTGCLGGLGLTGAKLPTEPVSTESMGQFRVDMIGAFNKTASFEGEIDEPITVQDVLERSGATRKYRNMDIMIHRVVEETGRVLKLRVDYVPRKKSVKPELNYAIHDKDRILVQSRTTTAISKVVDSLNPNQ
jgi:hypothetical protein